MGLFLLYSLDFGTMPWTPRGRTRTNPVNRTMIEALRFLILAGYYEASCGTIVGEPCFNSVRQAVRMFV